MIHRAFGIFLVIGSMVGVFLFEGSNTATGFMRILHWPAIVLTGVGPVGLILMSFDWDVLSRTVGLLSGKSPSEYQDNLEREAVALHRINQGFLEEGAAIFDTVKPKGISDTAKRVIERLAVRVPIADIREMILRERDKVQIRIVQALNVIGMGMKLAPSIGMLGTILGMVRLLETLQDPSHIGPHMSLALLTTFFGLFFSIVVWTPLQQKVERIFDLQLETFDQTVRWLELLEKRKPADYFAETAEIPAQLRKKNDKQAA